MEPNDKDDLIQRLVEESRIGDAGMLREHEPLTGERARQIIAEFRAYLERVGKSQEWAARSMGKNPGALVAVLNDVYTPRIESHVRDIARWLELRRSMAERPTGFVRTRVAESIFAAARLAQSSNAIVMAHGPAGVGKSICAKAVHAETPGSFYVSIRTAAISKTTMLKQIAGVLRIGGKGGASELFDHAAEKLAGTGRLGIFDEVHKLVGKRNDDGLHILRDLHDAAGIPMLWLGMSNLAAYVKTGKSEGNEPLDQLHSRVRLWVDIGEMAEGLDGGPGLATVEDIRAMIAATKVRSPFTPDAVRYLREMAHEMGEGTFRTVDTLIRLADAVMRGEPVDQVKLQAIQRRRLGVKVAEEINHRIEARLKVA